jgi:hypothetical protein
MPVLALVVLLELVLVADVGAAVWWWCCLLVLHAGAA